MPPPEFGFGVADFGLGLWVDRVPCKMLRSRSEQAPQWNIIAGLQIDLAVSRSSGGDTVHSSNVVLRNHRIAALVLSIGQVSDPHKGNVIGAGAGGTSEESEAVNPRGK